MNSPRTNHRRAIELRSYHRRRTRHLMAGLNTHGAAWGRTPTLMPFERKRRAQKLNLVRYHRRTHRRAAQGLNSRGNQYKTRVMERAWQRLKNEMETA